MTQLLRDLQNVDKLESIDKIQFSLLSHEDINRGSVADILTFDTYEECVNDSLDDPYERSFRISYDIDSTSYFGVFFFREAQSRFTELAEWVDVENKTDLDSSEMIDVLKLMPYRWDDAVSIDTSLWRKRKEQGNVQLDVENGTDWTRATKQDDGTTIYECSSDGENWTSCEG